MAFCTTCGGYFNGRGSHCTLHNPFLQSYYNATSDSTDRALVKYRTGHFIPGNSRTRKQLQLGLGDGYDMLDTYETPNAVSRYNDRSDSGFIGGPVGIEQRDVMLQPSTLRPLASAFTSLASTHGITSLTYTITPTGTRSITASANPDREQCPTCLLYFPDRRRLDLHAWEFPVGCELHGVCMREVDVGFHAQSERHGRCFVKGCMSVYRREAGWKGGVIEDHVRGWHA